MQDEYIITAIRAKDFSGLENLINEYSASMIKTIRAILSLSEEQAYHDDVLNAVLYQIWSRIDNFDSKKSSLQTWILVITRNRAIDEKRKLAKIRGRQTSEELVVKMKPDMESDRFAKATFLEMIDCLSSENQQIFLYYYFYQYKAREIAELLNISEETIFNRLSRGRKLLKEHLLQEGS